VRGIAYAVPRPKATREACREIRRIYETLGTTDRFAADFFDGPHRWEGRKVLPFLDRWL
jgi:hypothetical protein